MHIVGTCILNYIDVLCYGLDSVSFSSMFSRFIHVVLSLAVHSLHLIFLRDPPVGRSGVAGPGVGTGEFSKCCHGYPKAATPSLLSRVYEAAPPACPPALPVIWPVQ